MLKRLLLVLLVLGLIGSAVLLGLGHRSLEAMRTARNAEPVTVTIHRGTSLTGVLTALESQGLVPTALEARIWLVARRPDATLSYGTYRFGEGVTPIDVLDRLIAGRVELVRVTIPEGTLAIDIARRMVAVGIGDEATWNRLIADPAPIVDLAPSAPGLEGFLFPDTYDFGVETTPAEARDHLLERFRSVWAEERSAADSEADCLATTTLASLVEAETASADERPLIAGVFTNRLRRGMLLQCDPTVVYALRRHGVWEGRLTRAHWRFSDPFNTYVHSGLPPGPIGSPGRAALRAALEPEPTRHLYFVATPEGGAHNFSSNLKDHNRAVAQLRRSKR